ncbi:MAG TPA: glycosyltransferase family 4 protein [Candidatus Cloacimonadota bacterium]|nr:glycosyltransferase family 4 protein [Candidatus Cloacimonadota bacterium]
MKILFFTDILRAGGKERRIVELLKSLSQQGISCEIIVMSEKIEYPLIYQLGIPIHLMTYKFRKDPSPLWRFYKVCRAFRPDIVHSWSPMCTFYALPTVKILGIKLVISQIVNSPGYVKPFSKTWFANNLIYPFTDKIVSNSYAGLKDYHPPISKSVCIHNGFDFLRTHNMGSVEEIRNKFEIDMPYVVGMVASMGASKDWESYFKAAGLVLDKRRDISFLAVGDGPNFHKLKESIPNRLKPFVRFLGKQNNVEEIMNICDIGVLSTYTEGISNAILEFMALGKPVIATDGGGTNEIIVDEQTGYLVKIKAPYFIAEKISYLLDNPNLCKKMGMAGKTRVENEFSLGKMNQEFINLYTNLLFSKKRKHGEE